MVLIPSMQRSTFSRISLYLFFLLFTVSCSSSTEQNWTNLIPANSSFVIVPQEDVDFNSISDAKYATLLEDLTPTALQQISALDQDILNQIQLKAVVLFPNSSLRSELIWIAESNADLGEWATKYYEPLTQNNYSFQGTIIHKILNANSINYTAQVGNWIIFSPSSLGIEQALRAYKGDANRMEFPQGTKPGQLIMNSGFLDLWVSQFTNPAQRPGVNNAFSGLGTSSLTFTENGEEQNSSIQLKGSIPLSETGRTAFVDAISSKNAPITLDRFVAANAAAFAVMRLEPKLIPIPPAEILTDLDSLLLNSSDTFIAIGESLGDEFAFQALPESGLLATGEFLYLRKVSNRTELVNQLNNLQREGFINRVGNSYQINSSVLAKLLGSEMSPFTDFYLSLSQDVIAMAKRRGLSESVETDRQRRRVIYYEDTYASARESFPDEVSAFVWVKSSDFIQFLNPYLVSGNVLSGLLGKFDIVNISMVKNEGQNAVDFELRTLNREGSALPYNELWVASLGGSDLSATPVLGNIVGSSVAEIIFSTENGRVAALAADGTVVMETNTDGAKPVGGPVLYDWYANGQQVILLGAGSQIFAWNSTGTLLPNFPLQLGEQISSQIVVTDVLRNGIPEIVVATENRQIHVLDGRGQNVQGWPRSTNAVITSTPKYEIVDNVWSIWAHSQNTLHSWLRSGNNRPGYPQFMNAEFRESPMVYKNNVYSAGSDGYIYAVGLNPSFDESLATVISNDSLKVKSIYASNSELNNLGIQPNVLLRDSTGFYREDLLSVQSANGSIFLINTDGKLRFNQNLGQPSSTTFSPIVLDIDSNANFDLIALADFGRLFGWEVLTDKRIFSLPTSGMKYVLIADLNGDGLKEVIAQTREGLRSWTIFKEQ